MRLVLAIPFAVALAGCAAAAYQEPPATVWAYTGESAPTYGFRVVGYAESKEFCELIRAQDLHGTTQQHPYLSATFSETCRPALIGGAGADYWAYALPPLYFEGQAFGSKAQCEMMRKTAGPANVATACGPVSVRFLEQPRPRN